MTYQQPFVKSRLFILTISILCAFLGLWVLVFMTKPVSANTINVSPGDSIQAAIDSATAGDTILISAGVYTESLTLNKVVSLTGISSATTVIQAPANSRVISVGVNVDSSVVISGLAITGGDADTGAGLFLNGSPQLVNLTVHHNQGANFTPNTAANHPFGVSGGIYSAQPFSLKNSIIDSNIGVGILTFGDVKIVDSLISNNLCVPLPNETTCNGGGVAGWGNVYISRSEIRENKGGGFISYGGGVWGGRVAITDSKLISNSLGYALFTFGGGAYGISLTVNNSLVSGNIAAIGGGLAAEKAHIFQTDIIKNSTYLTDSNVSQGLGGGFSFNSGEVDQSLISENTAIYGGGGWYVDWDEVEPFTIKNSTFFKNKAYIGGAIEALDFDQPFFIQNSLFVENSAFHHGGAIASTDANFSSGFISITNSIFVNNDLNGPELESGTTKKGGSAIGSDKGVYIYLNHNTIFSNLGQPDSAIWLNSVAVLVNSSISGFDLGVETQEQSGLIFEGDNAFDNLVNISGPSGSLSPSLFDIDPQFVNPAANDFRLLMTSPLIGAAQQSTDTVSALGVDYAGYPRPMGGAPDIGAFEFVEHELTIFNTTVNPSDTPLGTISSSDTLIQCDQPICTQYYPHGTSVTLSASAVPTATFVSWGGKCIGTGTCTFFITQSTEIIALFKENDDPTETPTAVPTETHTPIPTKTSTPGPSQTPTAVPSETQTPTSTKTLTPVPSQTPTAKPAETNTPIPTETPSPVPSDTSTPNPIQTASPEPSETPTPIPNQTVTPPPTKTATPTLGSGTHYTVTVNLAGTGGGFVTGLPGFDTCETTCSAQVLAGTILQLELFLAPDSQFIGWSAPCSSSNICQLFVNDNLEVTATLKGKTDPTLLSKFVYLPLLTTR